jgi:threonine dehydrogenase-like Zn-dependent dehydrogenase
MRAIVTEGVGAMSLIERPEPSAPDEGHVMVRPDAVGICGSDYHFFAGELSEKAGGSTFPRVQGHEVAGRIIALGPGCRSDLAVDQPVALFPLTSCGYCYPCRIGRPNTCENFQLIGIHVDGGLQEQLAMAQEHVYPIHAAHPAVAAMTEPVSIAMRAVNRAQVQAGEHVAVLGAGPIGQCICLLARERGAEVLVIDLQERRLRLSREMGAETLVWESAAEAVAFAGRWAGPGGPPVAIDATGAPAAVRAMIDMVASAGRAVQVGMSIDEVSIRIGSLTEKELDLLGVCCCGGGDFAEAVAAVERNGPMLGRLVSHEFPLAQAPDALRFAMSNPNDVMKVVIRGD